MLFKPFKAVRMNQHGFTLVELMIVVAIIGILSAIAIPNFQKYQSKARQKEAQIQLSSIYTAEQSFRGEQNSFTGCLRQAGFVPEGDGTTNAGMTRFYTVGFALADANSARCGPTNIASCAQNYNVAPVAALCVPVDVPFNTILNTGMNAYSASRTVGPGNNAGLVAALTSAQINAQVPVAALGALTADQTRLSAGGFTAEARGNVAPFRANAFAAGTDIDIWRINHNKTLSNVQVGL